MNSMTTSSLSQIIGTTRLLETFNNEETREFKKYLLDQMECENEALLLSKVLVIIHKSLSKQSIDNLKNKAIEINEKKKLELKRQQTSHNDHQNESQASNTKFNHFKLLSSNTIDYFGSFLTKIESISFGYLNRDLYIETQKRSFLLKRENHESERIIIGDLEHEGKKNELKILNFIYSVPIALVLTQYGFTPQLGRSTKNMIESIWFQSLFTRLKSLTISANFLAYVPIHLLFNKHICNENHIAQFLFIVDNYEYYLEQARLLDNSVNKFIINYKKYFEDDCRSSNKVIRNIDRIGFDQAILEDSAATLKYYNFTNWILALKSNYTILTIGIACELNISTISELKTIFHSKLTHFGLGDLSNIVFNNIDNLKQEFKLLKFEYSQYLHKINKNIEYIESIDNSSSSSSISSISSSSSDDKFIDTRNLVRFTVTFCAFPVQAQYTKLIRCINSLDLFDLRNNVSIYSIRDLTEQQGMQNIMINSNDKYSVLNTLFFNLKMPMLNQKIISLTFTINWEYTTLIKTIQYFAYFYQNRERILNEFKNFYQIIFEWDFIFDQNATFSSYVTNPNIIGQITDEYDVNNRAVTIENFDLSEQSFANVYQNIVSWFQRIKANNPTKLRMQRHMALRVQKK